jgi:hypothetical protein
MKTKLMERWEKDETNSLKKFATSEGFNKKRISSKGMQIIWEKNRDIRKRKGKKPRSPKAVSERFYKIRDKLGGGLGACKKPAPNIQTEQLKIPFNLDKKSRFKRGNKELKRYTIDEFVESLNEMGANIIHITKQFVYTGIVRKEKHND